MRVTLDFPEMGTIHVRGELTADTVSAFIHAAKTHIIVHEKALSEGQEHNLDLREVTKCDDEGARAVLRYLALVRQIDNSKPVKVLGGDVVTRLLEANGPSKVLHPRIIFTGIYLPSDEGDEYYGNPAAWWI